MHSICLAPGLCFLHDIALLLSVMGTPVLLEAHCIRFECTAFNLWHTAPLHLVQYWAKQYSLIRSTAS